MIAAIFMNATIGMICFWRTGYCLDPIAEAEDHRDGSSAALKNAIISKDTKIRIRSAQVLGRIQKPESIDPLLLLLFDSKEQVRKMATFGLGQMGWEKSFSNGRELELAERLAALKSDRNLEIRQLAAEAIGKFGLLETPRLILPFLFDSSEEVRAEALMATARYRLVFRLKNEGKEVPSVTPDVMERFIQLSKDRSSQVRRNLAYFFSRNSDVRGSQIVLKLAQDKNFWTRYFATVALAKLNFTNVKWEALETALSLTKDDDYRVRIAALNAIRELQGSIFLNLDLLLDPLYAVRAAMAQVLGPTHSESALKSLWDDPSPIVKSEALKAIVKTRGSHYQNILKKAQLHSNWIIREASVIASRDLPEQAHWEILKFLKNDPHNLVRAIVLESLGLIERPEVVQWIGEALGSHELAVRGSAVQALTQLKDKNITVPLGWRCYQNSLKDSHGNHETWVEVREEIVHLLGQENSSLTTEFLMAAAHDPSASVSYASIRYLVERGVQNVPVPPPFQFTYSPYRELRFAVNPKLILKVETGEIIIELFAKDAPVHVANVAGFVKTGGYDGLPVHRVVSNFVIQGGDPDRSGWGSAGYTLRAEINSRRFEEGTVGMPRSRGFDTGGIQFFITHVPTPHLDGQYTVFGKVIRGMDVLHRVQRGDLILKALILE